MRSSWSSVIQNVKRAFAVTIHRIETNDDRSINVDLANNCGSWSWREVDNYGMYIGKTSLQFNTKEEAIKNALDNFGGSQFL